MTQTVQGLTVVALGASAGGLEALQRFFAAMPADRRLAFVVITHLSPQHPSHMAELLGRVSTMPVTEAQDGERIQAGHVYVIPPNTLMGIRRGALNLTAASQRPTIPRPIDHFMCALAEDQQERSVGIVLSGADHDGTAGLKEIKAVGGMTMAQSPNTAQYPSMPNSAIGAGAPDQVLPVEAMGQALLDYVAHAPLELLPLGASAADSALADAGPTASGAAAATAGDAAGMAAQLAEILELVKTRTGHDFRWYRPAMLLRRLRRRMGLKAVGDVAGYLALLRESADETDALLKDFLISITEFFRDPEAWRALEDVVIPQLLQQAAAGNAPVRVWTPGCATGEESYSIAMTLLEALAPGGLGEPRVNVFGSDVDTDALRVARAGSYPESISVAVSPERLARFFEKSGGRYVVRKELREAVLFAPQDLVRDPPFSKLDLIICRNVLIYFEPALQSRILELFHFALNPGGVLLLGKSESLGGQTELFEPISRAHRMFRRVGTPSHLPRGFSGRWSALGGFITPMSRPAGGGRSHAEPVREQLGEREPGAAVLINRDHRALYFHGETGRYLQCEGEPSLDLLSLLAGGLRTCVRAALRRASTETQPVVVTASIKREGRPSSVTIRVEPLKDAQSSGLLLVCFDEPAAVATTSSLGGQQPTDSAAALGALEEELRIARGELMASVREAESANAELHIANEEAMSMNEELQSSNEELETSKEELQSLNEELSTVNNELEEKLAELASALSDLRNLMDSTRVATLFLDRELRIRRFTKETTRLFRLIPADEGRPLRDITSHVTDPDLFGDAEGVLDSLAPADREVATPEGEWFLRRILPYRTREEHIEGVVVTYTDITVMRLASQQARRLAAVLRDSNDAVIVYDFGGRILSWNRGAEKAYGYSRDAAGTLRVEQLCPEAHRAAALAVAEQVRQTGAAETQITQRLTADRRILDVSITVSPLRDDAGQVDAVVSTERDITEKLRLESELRFRAMADDIPTLLRIEDAAGQAQFLNRAWLQFTGESAPDGLLAQGWLRYIHPDDLPAYLQVARRARRGGERFAVDLRLRRGDGGYRWMRSTEVARSDAKGECLGYVSVLVDIEERKIAEQALAEQSARKDEFLAMLAHELRNPLLPVRNAAAVIERLALSEPKIAWATGVITRQTQQLSRLVDDLMDVARISNGKVALSREPVEISVLVDRARDSCQPLFEARRQVFTAEVPGETLLVEGDLIRLTQVVSNLLNNASKYSPEGSAIELAVSASATQVEIRVTDHGAGIAPDMLPRVFDLFAQADRTLDRAQGGLGIGLTLVQRLVNAHGGSVEARSAGLGCGSRFVVRLPLLDVPAATASVDTPAADVAQPGLRRVLVVDDDMDNASSTAAILEQAGHAVQIARDGEDALDVATRFQPDVVVADIGLPRMSGYDLALQLRERRDSAGVVLIALTGYGQPEDLAHTRAAGFDYHLVKPTSPDQLVALVGRGTRTRPATIERAATASSAATGR